MARFRFVLRTLGALVAVLAVSFVSAGSAGAVSHLGTVAGTGNPLGNPLFNDDRAARETNIVPVELVFDPVSGELHFNDRQERIRKLTKKGRVETVAGTGISGNGFNNDHTALETNIYPSGLVFDPVGERELYFVDGGSRIRKVTRDGRVATVAGTGLWEFNDDGAVTETNINPRALAFDPVGGELYFIDGDSRIRKVTRDGKVATVAGTGLWEFNDDGAATETNINPEGLVFDPAGGDLYFNDGGSRIRKVTQYGKVETVAGTGTEHFNEDGAATETNINPVELLFDPVGGGTLLQRRRVADS